MRIRLVSVAESILNTLVSFFLCSLFFFYCDLVFVNVDQSFFLLIVFLFVLFLWDCLLVHPLNIFVDSPFEYVC